MTSEEKINLTISAKDHATKLLNSIKQQILSVGGAYLSWRAGSEMIQRMLSLATQYEANMVSLNGVVMATGRNMTEVLSEMRKHMGGLASDVNVTTGFLKGMSTKLTTKEISNLTFAVKDASIAMGEDFNIQLPLIIKGLKQLNPAILDNIGVTVRLDQVNKRITEGYYGLNTEINEATQQQAIYAEIMRQTRIFKGQEEKYLRTAQGQWRQLTTAVDNALTSLGRMLTGGYTLKLASELGKADEGAKGLVESLNDLSIMVQPIGYGLKGVGLSAKAAYYGLETLVNVARVAYYDLEALYLLLTGRWAAAKESFNRGNKNVIDSFKDMKEAIDKAAESFFIMTMGPVNYDGWLRMIEGLGRKTQKTAEDMYADWEREWQDRFMFGMTEMTDANKDANDAMRFYTKFTYQDINESLNDWESGFRRGMKGMVRDKGKSDDSIKAMNNMLVASIANDFIDLMFSTRKTWEQMSADFIKLFLKTILIAVDSKSAFASMFLNSFKFWDVAANDRALIEEGRRAGMFIQKGLNESAMYITPPAITISGNTGSVGNVIINFNSPVSDKQFIRNTVIPEIEKAIINGRSKLSMRNIQSTATVGVRI